MSDLIKREDAIKALYKYNFVTKEVIEREIMSIPSADTDLSGYSDKLWKNAYERGKEEEHRWWSEHCAKCTDADRPRGEVDAIDRDALIDYCLKLIDVERKQGSDVMNYGQERVNQTEAIIDYIEYMPHVNADRPRGEWIWSPRDTDGTVSGCCSNCSFSHLFIGGHTAQYNFCPNCGAKMDGKRKESE